MIIIRPEDVLHKTWLLRLLTQIADNSVLSGSLYFKGGTCASSLGFLDRFSVDLDFDLKPGVSQKWLRKEFHRVFTTLGLTVKSQSQKTLSFLLKYDNPKGRRNTLRLNALPNPIKANKYQPQYLAEIDRIFICQTVETMFANKLVAPIDRFKKYKSIAGRDFYDIHHFFLSGYRYEPAVISERTQMTVPAFLGKLVDFTKRELTETVINEDLNALLPLTTFQKIRPILKRETLMFLENELARTKKEI